MKKKLVFGLSAAVVSGAFWACGSGEIINYDQNLEELALAVVENIGDAEIAKAIASCEADTLGCAVEMHNAGSWPPSSGGTAPSSSSVQRSSSSNQLPKSSMAPQSSMTFVPQSSSAPVFASSTSNPPAESSSSSVIVGPGSDYGTCAPVKNPINRGEKTAWKMTKNAAVNAQVILNADFDWTFVDGTPATSAKHGNMSSDEITYATSGLKAATLVFTPQGGAPAAIDCTPLQVNGAAITGCKCAATSATVDVAEGGVATWSVSGCTSSGATITGYTWGGTGVTGEGTSGTATLAAKGDVAQATVVVANDDNTEITVTCDEVKAVDSNIPDFEIKTQQDKVTFDKSGEFALVASLAQGWHNQDQYCSLACNGGNSSYSIEIDGIKLSGTNYQSAQNKLLVAHTVGGYSMPVKATIPDGESVTCEISW